MTFKINLFKMLSSVLIEHLFQFFCRISLVILYDVVSYFSISRATSDLKHIDVVRRGLPHEFRRATKRVDVPTVHECNEVRVVVVTQ